MTESQEFISATITLRIENEALDKHEFYDLKMYASIDKVLPSLTFKIHDKDGEWIRKCKLYIGANVDVSIYSSVKNSKGETPIDSYSSFVVTKIYDGFEYHNDKLSGYIQVWCEHSWALYGNYTCHAYPPQKISDTIKDVLNEVNKNVTIHIDDDYLKDSSDEGTIPRYKVGESDIEFIKHKLLPYLNVDMSNGFFFVDLKSYPRINSFNSMFSVEPVLVIVPESEIRDGIQEEIENYCKDKGYSHFIEYVSMNIIIGNENIQKQFGQIKEKVYLDNNISGKTLVGVKPASVSCGQTSGMSVKDKIPFNAIRIETVEASSSTISFFHPFDDAVMSATNRGSYLNDMFTITLNLSGYVSIQPGDTIQLYAPKYIPKKGMKDERIDVEEKIDIEADTKLRPWITGKWLIKSITTAVTDTPEKVMSILEVIRPTFMFNKLDTTIATPGRFHSVS